MLKKHKHILFIILALLVAYPVFLIALPGCGASGGGGNGFNISGTAPTYAPVPEEPAPNAPEPEPAAPAPSSKYAYVTIADGGDDGPVVDVYNADTFTFVKKMGKNDLSMPEKMCFSHTTRTGGGPKYLYLANRTNVKRFNLETQEIDGWVAVSGIGLWDVKITPDDKYLYTVNVNTKRIIVTNVETKQDIKAINPGIGGSINRNAMTSDGLYMITTRVGEAPNYGIPIIETTTNTVWKTATITIDAPYEDVAIDPSNIYAYVCLPGANKIAVVHIQSGQVVGSVDVGNHPAGITITPDGVYAYVTNLFGSSVSVLRLNGANPTELSKITVGAWPTYPGVSSDGKFVWVPCQGSDNVYIIKTEDNTVYKILHSDVGPIHAIVE